MMAKKGSYTGVKASTWSPGSVSARMENHMAVTTPREGRNASMGRSTPWRRLYQLRTVSRVRAPVKV